MKKYFFVLFILSSAAALGQIVFEESSSPVYDLLNRLSVKGIIEFNDELKPLSRIGISR